MLKTSHCIPFTIALLVAACADQKQPRSERTTEQPTEVSGGFGLTMQCSVLNSDVEGATSSSIGCLVSNDDGSRYTGPITDTSAEIVTSSGQVLKTTQIASGTSAGSYSIGVEVSGLTPKDAATIRVTAKFDKAMQTLVASLKGRLTTTCVDNMTFWVRSESENAAYKNNFLCSQDAPCSSVSRAISLMPDVINCDVTINVGEGEYVENIKIDTKQVGNRHKIMIKGAGIDRTKIKAPSAEEAVVLVAGFYSMLYNQKTVESLIGNLVLTGLELTGADAPLGASSPTTQIGVSNRSSAITLSDIRISNVKNGITVNDTGYASLARL